MNTFIYRSDYMMALPSVAARPQPRSQTADRPKGRINPPFNIKEWWDGKLEGDARWSRSDAESASHTKFYPNRGKYGTPPQTATRECAPLKTEGIPQVVSATRDNRVALPCQLFTNTQIPACIWFLTKNKAVQGDLGSRRNILRLAA